MKVVVIDLDGTLTIDEKSVPYAQRQPRLDVISKLRLFKDQGYRIIINTSRNMNTYGGNVGIINIETLPVILDWLKCHDVPFDEVVVGKPWCGHDGFYVDDKAVRPDEFVKLTPAALRQLVSVQDQE